MPAFIGPGLLTFANQIEKTVILFPALVLSGGSAAAGEGVGLFSLQGVTRGGLLSGGADFTVQMAVNKGDIANWNIAGTLSQVFFKNPFGSAIVGTTMDFRLSALFSNSYSKKLQYTVFGEGKSFENIALDSSIGGLFN